MQETLLDTLVSPARCGAADTRWGLASRAGEMDAGSDVDAAVLLDARYLSGLAHSDDDELLLCPADLKRSAAVVAAAAAPAQPRMPSSSPAGRPQRTLVSSLPVPLPDALAAAAQVPPPRSTSAGSAGGSSSSADSDDSASGSSATRSRRARTLSRLCKSPDGPKFASGAFKNAPPPTALPPPPATFCVSPPAPRGRPSPSLSPPPAQWAAPVPSHAPAPIPDPAIIALARAPQTPPPCAAPAVAADPCQVMTTQLIQLLGIKAH